jgi:hypothetical protein
VEERNKRGRKSQTETYSNGRMLDFVDDVGVISDPAHHTVATIELFKVGRLDLNGLVVDSRSSKIQLLEVIVDLVKFHIDRRQEAGVAFLHLLRFVGLEEIQHTGAVVPQLVLLENTSSVTVSHALEFAGFGRSGGGLGCRLSSRFCFGSMNNTFLRKVSGWRGVDGLTKVGRTSIFNDGCRNVETDAVG